MVVTTIYVTRHGFRGNWTVDPKTGQYFTHVKSPTGIASDPPLAAYGVHQAAQLAIALSAIKDPPITSIYSSPFYRCLQTVQPFAEKSGLEVKGDNGFGEWYGLARFTHPPPATPSFLHSLFPSYALGYKPSIIPSASGENITQLHDRIAYALEYVIAKADIEDAVRSIEGCGEAYVEGDVSRKGTAILICTHAASLIAIGRALTGKMPQDVSEEDFKTYTCGISKFQRRMTSQPQDLAQVDAGVKIPHVEWADGRGVAGGWYCEINGDCTHLDGGEERGWHFHGDEAFDQEERVMPSKL